MLSNDSASNSAKISAEPKVLDPNDSIEVAATGGGTVTDPAPKDNRPPNIGSEIDPSLYF